MLYKPIPTTNTEQSSVDKLRLTKWLAEPVTDCVQQFLCETYERISVGAVVLDDTTHGVDPHTVNDFSEVASPV